jgi:hypothetical protein
MISQLDGAAVCSLDRGALLELLLGGHAIDPASLDGWVYRGVSLGLPAWVDRLAWKTFAKAFEGGRGWNVRMQQDVFEPLRDRRGAPRCFGHFAVTPLPPVGDLSLPVSRGVLLDYGRGGNGRLDPVRFLRDPLVALSPGDPNRLLGCSLVEVGPARFTTPSFFLLERHAPVSEFGRPAADLGPIPPS